MNIIKFILLYILFAKSFVMAMSDQEYNAFQGVCQGGVSKEQADQLLLMAIKKFQSRKGIIIKYHDNDLDFLKMEMRALLGNDEFTQWQQIIKRDYKLIPSLKMIETWLATKKVKIKPSLDSRLGLMKLISNIIEESLGADTNITISIAFENGTRILANLGEDDPLEMGFVSRLTARNKKLNIFLDAPLIAVSFGQLMRLYQEGGKLLIQTFILWYHNTYLHLKHFYEKNIPAPVGQEGEIIVDKMTFDSLKERNLPVLSLYPIHFCGIENPTSISRMIRLLSYE